MKSKAFIRSTFVYRRLALIFVLWSGVFISPSFSPSHTQERSTPYIYYFSDDLNAFIIERADGTDTRVLGDGLMALAGDAQHIHVAGPGWSPSGQWFAWTAAQVREGGLGKVRYRPYIMNADGTQRLTLLDHLRDAELAWASDEDVLFVVSQQVEFLHPDDPDDTHSVTDTYLAMIDVANQTVLSSKENRIFLDSYPYYSWSVSPTTVETNDGAHLIAKYFEFEDGDKDYGTPVTALLGTDGMITEKRLNEPVRIDGRHPRFPSISPAGWVAYPAAHSFRIENVLTGEQHTFPPLDDPQEIQWDASGQYALLDDGNAWLLDCDSGILSLLRDNLELADRYFFDYFDDRPAWSPGSNHAIFLGSDGVVYGFNRADGVLFELPIGFEKGTGFPGWYWLDDSRFAIYWAGKIKLAICYFESSCEQYIDVDIPDSTQPRLSPDGRRIAFVRDGAVIYDQKTATEVEVRPNYGSFDSFPGGEVVWHDSGEWLFVYDNAVVAGGGDRRQLSIVSSDGRLHRDLSFSWTSNSITLNWLPRQVDVDDLPPPIASPLFPHPDMTLEGSHWSNHVDWSPDGRWLASGLDWGRGGDITVWEVGTGEIVHVFKDAEKDERAVWLPGDKFVPALSIPDHLLDWRTDGILACSPDGHQVVQNKDYTTRVVDTDTGYLLAELHGEWGTYFFSASYSPNGRWLVAASPHMPVHIWNTATWEIVATLPNPGQAVAFSPDGMQLAVTASWDVQIWDVATLLGSDIQ
jgi:WD40 repeat protein